jgi:hypothetical protein
LIKIPKSQYFVLTDPEYPNILGVAAGLLLFAKSTMRGEPGVTGSTLSARKE